MLCTVDGVPLADTLVVTGLDSEVGGELNIISEVPDVRKTTDTNMRQQSGHEK